VLPPGQKSREDFPRFGLPRYADRFPSNTNDLCLTVKINDADTFEIDLSTTVLPETRLQSDFHCVTTWSYLGVTWGGVRFIDFYEKHIQHNGPAGNPLTGAVVYAQDGYKTSLLLEDLLQPNVLLAYTLDNKPLTIDHGAPLRLVAPNHYGYKNLKHLSKLEFYSKLPVIKRGIRAFLDHPRARVTKEERGRWVPGSILRYLYRPLITGTVKDFRRAMEKFKS